MNGYSFVQIIALSASANKLSNIQKQADEYASLIMEELDPDNLGYIMVKIRIIYYIIHHINDQNYFFIFPSNLIFFI